MDECCSLKGSIFTACSRASGQCSSFQGICCHFSSFSNSTQHKSRVYIRQVCLNQTLVLSKIKCIIPFCLFGQIQFVFLQLICQFNCIHFNEFAIFVTKFLSSQYNAANFVIQYSTLIQERCGEKLSSSFKRKQFLRTQK